MALRRNNHNKSSKTNRKIDEEDDLDLDVDLRELEEDLDREVEDIPRTRNSGGKTSQGRGTGRGNSPTQRVKESQPKSQLAIIVTCTVVIIVLLASVGVLFFKMNRAKAEQAEVRKQAEQQVKQAQEKAKEEASDPSIKPNDYEGMKDTVNFVPSKDFFKDMSGGKSDKDFQVNNTEVKTGILSFKKIRTMIGDGVMICWLDGLLENKYHYKVEVPYSLWSQLKETDTIPVQYEELNTDGGKTVISFVRVVPDWKKAIDEYNQKKIKEQLDKANKK